VPPGSDAPLTDPGSDVVTGLSYGTVSDDIDLAPGSYAVSVRAAGSARTVPPVLSTRVEVPAGAPRTVTLAGRFADLALHPLEGDLSAPPDGSARVRVLAAAGTAPVLDVGVRGGPALATALRFGAAGEAQTVSAGTATLTVRGSSDGPAEIPLSLAAGSVVTLLVLDDPHGGLTVRPVVDAAGPAVVPTGGVEAARGRLGAISRRSCPWPGHSWRRWQREAGGGRSCWRSPRSPWPRPWRRPRLAPRRRRAPAGIPSSSPRRPESRRHPSASSSPRPAWMRR
jgi:hypothetical protein